MASDAATEGLRCLKVGRLEDAVRAFHRGLWAQPDDEACLLGLARTHLAQGDAAGAEPHLRRLVQLCPEHLEARSHLAVLQASAGDAAAGERLEAIAAEPTAGFFEHYNLGHFLLERGDEAGAEAAFRAGLQRWPDNAFALFELGRLALRQERIDEAIELLGRATKLSSDKRLPVLLLSRAHTLKGELGQALNLVRLACKLSPDDPVPHEDFYRLCMLAGDFPAAAQKAIDLRLRVPGHADYLYMHGVALLASAEFVQARAVLEELCQQVPESLEARRALAQACEQLEDLPAAQTLLEDVVRQAPTDVDAVNDLATLYFRMKGGAERARGILARALAAHPEHPGLHLNHAIALLDSDKGAAQRHASKASTSADHAVRVQAQQLLRRLGARP
ncbi:tetratricopeptide repeat protein [Cystobacter fuscus]|uniref:tetratricopeptide repeat protein n=1 Tax=Cystobacter fuscus TaxID=43 RepID=UPI002B2E4637|nr:tetratricopeptide repeat protein [Cystobacter fuscus]